MQTMIGVIGGSGVYEIDGLQDAVWTKVETPWGTPSDEILVGKLDGVAMAFLPRHGRGHVHSPTSVPYRANIDALKRLGVTDVVSVSACGSLREEMAPGDFVIVDQFIDRSFARDKSFFGQGCVAHVALGKPTCARLGSAAAEAARATGIRVHTGGTYLCMEGPQFSTLAESLTYKAQGYDIIHMTSMPEAKLAREAEITYAVVAMVTDYDCWHAVHGAVDVASLLRVMEENRGKAQRLFARLARDFPAEHVACPVGSDRALEGAILTHPTAREPELLAKLKTIAGRVLGG